MMDKQTMLKTRADQEREKEEEKQKAKKKAKQDQYKRAGKVVGYGSLIILVSFFLIIVLSSVPPTQTKLASEYTEFFETPCIKPWEKTLARERGEDWSNQVKQTIIDQVRDQPLDYRKEIYKVHVQDCERVKKRGAVRDIAQVNKKVKLSLAKKQSKRTPAKTEVVIERGADIDSYLNDDRFINPVVGLIQGDGYRCNSIGSIKVYEFSDLTSIRVICNGGRDAYMVRIEPGGLARVARD